MSSSSAVASKSASIPSNKKRKECDTTSVKVEDKKSYEELEIDLVEKDKKIVKLEQMIEELKAKNERDNQGGDDEDDDLSDIEELDSSDSWNCRYLQLREFRIINGHCNVAASVGNFGQWVGNQRRAYKNIKFGKKGLKISPERIALLDGLGFNWGQKFPAKPSWGENYAELQKYQKAMGNCNIRMDPKNPSNLATWVSAQRVEYRHFRNSRASLLTLEQIGQLKEINFKFKGPRLV
jgi:hypothetical protein